MPFTFQETILKLGKAIKRTFAKLLTKEFHNIKKNMNDIRKSIKTYSKYKFFSEDNRQILDNQIVHYLLKWMKPLKLLIF